VERRFSMGGSQIWIKLLRAHMFECRNAEFQQEFAMKQKLRDKRVSHMLVAGSDQMVQWTFSCWQRWAKEEVEHRVKQKEIDSMPMSEKGDAYFPKMRSTVAPRAMVMYGNLDEATAFSADDSEAIERKKDRELMEKHGVSMEDFDLARSTFNEIDNDRNEYVDRGEFEQLICKLLKAKDKYDIPASRMNMYWSFCDVNRTGKVTFPGFLVWWNRHGKTIGQSNLVAQCSSGKALAPRVQVGNL